MLVSLTVGKVDAGVTVLLTPDKRLVGFQLKAPSCSPLRLEKLVLDVHAGADSRYLY
jgi:hypothetical protein